MLSSGTRIGSTKILSWLGEGSTGQSYHCEATEGDFKGEDFYVKLIPREISETNGFEDHFMQECQMLEQLEGRGIWPVKAFGIMKWKHWVGYEWLEGELVEERDDAGNDEGEVRPSSIRSLNDLLEVDPCRVTPDLLLNFMVSLHCGLYRIHQSGIAHGNVKPSNLLVRCNEKGEGEAWVTETGLFRLSKFKPIGGDENRAREITFLNQDGRSSLEEGDRFRPANSSETSVPDESWDIHALGKVVIWILEKTQGNPSEWNQWKSWAEQAAQENLSLSFPSIAHSMQGLPGIGDLSDYGIKVDELSDEPNEELEAIRERRERKWALTEKENSVRFRRNMTGLVGSLFLLFSLCSGIYLYFMPGPWTERGSTRPDAFQLPSESRSHVWEPPALRFSMCGRSSRPFSVAPPAAPATDAMTKSAMWSSFVSSNGSPNSVYIFEGPKTKAFCVAPASSMVPSARNGAGGQLPSSTEASLSTTISLAS